MTALVFPPPPLTIGQEYSAPNGVTYVWDGEAWVGGFGTVVPLWTDNATSQLMSPIAAGRSLALSRDSALHFGDPASSCPCLESDGDNLNVEVRGACAIVVNGFVIGAFTSDGLAVLGRLSAQVGGDLVGALPNPTLRDGVIPPSLPPTGPAGGDLAGSNYPWPVIAPGAVTAAKIAPGVLPTVPTSLPPSGAAGGDLAGSSYPAPVLAAGVVTAAKLAAGVLPTTLPPSGAAGGDLAGSSYPAPVVAAGKITAAKIAQGGTVYAQGSVSAPAAVTLAAAAKVVVEQTVTLDQTRPVLVLLLARLTTSKLTNANVSNQAVLRLAVGGTAASDGTDLAVLDPGSFLPPQNFSLTAPVSAFALYVPSAAGATRFKLYGSSPNTADYAAQVLTAQLTVLQLS